MKKKRRGSGEGGDEEAKETTEGFKWTNNKSHKTPLHFFLNPHLREEGREKEILM